MSALLRVVAAVVAFLARVLWMASRRNPDVEGEVDGVSYVQQLRTYALKIRGFRAGIAFPTSLPFELRAAGALDDLLRTVQLTRPLQTGDEAFDRSVLYDTGSGVSEFFRSAAPARDAIVAAFSAGFEVIAADGRLLWGEKRRDSAAARDDVKELIALRAALAPLTSDPASRWTFARLVTLVLDAIAVAVAAYGLTAFVERYVVDIRANVHFFEIFGPAVMVYIAAGFAFTMVAVLLRGSPHMRHLLAGGPPLLFVGLLFGGFQIASDVNQFADRSAALVVTRRIKGTEVHSGRYSDYHYINLLPPDAPEHIGVTLPEHIEVARELWLRARRGGSLRLSIGRGLFGVPWYRDIVVTPALDEAAR
jgi:hypothetical protein